MYKIRGTVPASNYLQVPKRKFSNLGLTGRFLYIQVCCQPGMPEQLQLLLLWVPRSTVCTVYATHVCIFSVQIKVSPVKVFVVHLELMTEDQNIHRVSISSMYTAEALRVSS